VRSPWSIGRESVKANAVPMVVLWFLAGTTVLAYYFVPGTAAAFEPLKRWQIESGWIAAFLNRAFFCGILPGVFLVTVKSIRPRRLCLTVFVYSLWGGMWGILCDVFFTLQTAWFGAGTGFVTLLAKTFVDQFVWTVFICLVPSAAFFFWAARDFSFVRTRREWPERFLRGVCLPMLLANWCVWFPVEFCVYAFPLPLQIQIVGFASAFWMLVALQAGARSATKAYPQADRG